MKFLFTAPRFHTNQVPIVKGLIKEGHEVRYFVVFVGATEDHTYCRPNVLKPSFTTVIEKKRLSKTKTPSEVENLIGGHFIPNYYSLKKSFEEYMPDVVICRDKTYLTLCVKSICDKYGVPCILYDQQPIFSLYTQADDAMRTSVKNSFAKRVRIKLERILNPDLHMVQRMRRTSGFPEVRITPVKYKKISMDISNCKKYDNAYFVPFVMDFLSDVKNKKYCTNGIVNLLSVGKFRDYKNLLILIEVANILRRESTFKWHITVIGQVSNSDEQEYYNNFIDLVRENDLNDFFTVKCNIPYTDMSDEYFDHDVFILTSRRELASISVLEAMAHGLAVVSTDYNGTASYVLENEAGYVFETENPRSLVDAIFKIYDRGITELGNNAKEAVFSKYTWNNVEENLFIALRMAGAKI